MQDSINPVGRHAMVLAAGLGTRMRPLTNDLPKPLIEVAGRPIIDYVFDHLSAGDVQRAVVNVHYLPTKLIDWSRKVKAPKITISDESDAILNTGGGVARALPILGRDPFFVLNSDSFWVSKNTPALELLRAAWDPGRMDCLMLLIDPTNSTGYDGGGDFDMDQEGRLTRKASTSTNALAYIGCYLVHPRLFELEKRKSFSMMTLWEKAIEQGRLFGLVYDGHWLHIGTPEALIQAESVLAAQQSEA